MSRKNFGGGIAAHVAAAAATISGDPSNPFNWGLDREEQARECLLKHIEMYSQTYGSGSVPVITEDFRTKLMDLAVAVEELSDKVKEAVVLTETMLTADTDDDDYRKMWAYMGPDGNTCYAATKQEAISHTKLADLKTVRVAFVVPQSDGTYREIRIGGEDS